MKKILLAILFFPILLIAQKDCKKSFIKNEYDEIKEIKKIETKWTFYARSMNTTYGVSFILFNKLTYIKISSTSKYVVENGSDIGFLFDDGSTELIKFEYNFTTTYAGRVPISYQNIYFLNSTNIIEKFKNKTIVKITQYSGSNTFNVDEKKALKIKDRFNCLISEVGYNNILTEDREKSNNNKLKNKEEEVISTYEDNSEFTFRRTLWGMSMEDVMSSEEGSFDKSDNILAYNDKYIGGKKCVIGYVFSKGMLVRAKYIFEESHSAKNLYLVDYQFISKILTTKYSTSSKENSTWLNDLYKDNIQKYGMAISAGHYSKSKQWNLTRSTIFHSLFGDNYEIKHIIEYSSNLITEESKDFSDDF
jgi:hypothetical protein